MLRAMDSQNPGTVTYVQASGTSSPVSHDELLAGRHPGPNCFMAGPDDLILDATLIVAAPDPKVALLTPVGVPRISNLPILDIILYSPAHHLHCMTPCEMTSHVVIDSACVILEIRVDFESRLHRPASHDHALDLSLATGCQDPPSERVLVMVEVAVLPR